jgi:hypothetical protein
MRFWNRQNKLADLQRQMDSLNQQIVELQAEISELTSGSIDPVLNRFLKLQFGFDYATEKEALDRQVKGLKWQLKELENEKAKLESQISEEAFREECKRRGIKFIGEDVEGYEFSTVKIRCSNCGHKFSVDLRAHGSWNNIWAASTSVALQQLYAMKYNRFWPLQCPRCKRELDVWVTREKI